jgi:hypothetical protein
MLMDTIYICKIVGARVANLFELALLLAGCKSVLAPFGFVIQLMAGQWSSVVCIYKKEFIFMLSCLYL